MKIYVSATLTDLRAYRAAVMSAIRVLGHEALGMEDDHAENQVPAEKSAADVARSDIYLGIVAWRYGFVPDGYDCSVTEFEYRTAIKESIPRLIFLLDENAAWPPRLVDRGEDLRRVEAFRERLRKDLLISFFENPDDLRAKATAAIVKEVARLGGGEARLARLASPPERLHVFLSRLPMTGAARFGRDAQLRRMDEAWDNSRINVLSVVAWGGVGKSALVNTWLARMANDNYRGAARAYGWSFYSQDAETQEASADVFIAESLKWFGDPDVSAGSQWEKGERLAELVREQRTLLVLDGLEVLQQQEPFRSDEGRLKDQAMQALLRALAYQNPGLCVIATRSPVFDLQTFLSNTVEEITLEQLTPEAGAELLTSLGVKGTKAELIQAAQELGGHALALTLLGGYLAEWHDGQIWKRGEISEEEGDQWRRMIMSYERMLGEGNELAVLRIVSLFGGPAHADALAALRQPPTIQSLTDDLSNVNWNRAVTRLRKLNLLAAKNPDRPESLEAHPLLRQHFSHQLKAHNASAWREANDRLYEHYRQLPGMDLPDTLDEMVPLFHAVSHGCRAGRYQEVWDDVYWSRIRRDDEGFSVLILGAWGADLAALANFFPGGWDHPVAELDRLANARALTEAAFNLRGLGRLDEAVSSGRAGMNMHLADGRLGPAGDAAGNLSEVLVTFGDLKQAIAIAQQSIDLAEKSRRTLLLITNRATLADALHQRGEVDAAKAHFEEAEKSLPGADPSARYLHALRGYHFCDLLLGLGSWEDVLTRAEASLEVDRKNGLPHGIGLAYLAMARMYTMRATATDGADYPKAMELMTRAMAELKRVGHQELIVRGLLAKAELNRVLGSWDEAEVTLDEALATAVRGQMRLHQADTCLHYSHLYLASDRIDAAKRNLAEARRRIHAMGYHRRDAELLALASKLES